MPAVPKQAPVDSDRAGKEKAEARLFTVGLWVIIGVCLGAAVGVWAIPWIPSQNPQFGMTFLQWIKGLARPEVKEQNVAHLFFASSVMGGILAGWIARRWAPTCSDRSLRLLSLSAASTCLAAAGLVFWVSKWSATTTTIFGPRFDAAALGIFIAGVAVWAWLKTAALEKSAASELVPLVPMHEAAMADGAKPSLAKRVLSRVGAFVTWHDPLVLLFLIAIIGIPDPHAEAGVIWGGDKFHHWNHFIFGPGLYAKAGSVPGLDFYSQYGIGIPAVWALLSRFGLDGSLESILPFLAGAVIVYYFVIWRVLRRLTRRPIWAFAGVVMALALELFAGVVFEGAANSVWMTPSSMILRGPLDILVLLFLLWAAATPALLRKLGLVLLASVFVGLSLFWETDTGIWISLAFAATVVATIPKRFFSLETVPIVAVAILGTLSGFWAPTVAFYGTRVLSERFIQEMYFPIWVYSTNGLGAMPFSWDFEKNPQVALTNFIANVFTPGIYAAAAALGIGLVMGLWRNQRSQLGVALCYLGILGFGLYHMYLNRSHPFNWYHSIHPAVMIGTIVLARLIKARSQLLSIGRHRHPWLDRYALVPVYLALIAFAAMFVWGEGHKGFLFYHNYRSYAWDAYRFQTNNKAKPPHYMAEERKLGKELQGMTEPNEPLLVLSLFDVQILNWADRPPVGANIPPLQAIISKEILDKILSDLNASPPRYVVYDRKQSSDGFFTNDVFVPMRAFVEANYTKVKEVGLYEIWQRKAG